LCFGLTIEEVGKNQKTKKKGEGEMNFLLKFIGACVLLGFLILGLGFLALVLMAK